MHAIACFAIVAPKGKIAVERLARAPIVDVQGALAQVG
jgi:hypothetical protein